MIISQKFCLNFFFNARKRKRIILYINRNENSKNLKKKRWGWNLCDFTKQTSDQVWRNHSKWPNEYAIIRSYSCSKCQTTKTVTLHSWSLVSQEPFHQRESQFFTITTFFWMKRASVNDRVDCEKLPQCLYSDGVIGTANCVIKCPAHADSLGPHNLIG